MQLSTGMKVGLVSLFSCLALLLGLFSLTGVASTHTTNTLQSAHISSVAFAEADCPAGTVTTFTFNQGHAPNIVCNNPNDTTCMVGTNGMGCSDVSPERIVYIEV